MNLRIQKCFIGLVLALTLVGCDGKGGSPDGGSPDGGVPDGGVPDAGSPDGGSPDGGPTCYTDPHTHVEILNACTTSQGIDKQPTLPLLRSDGSLPPLP